MALTLPCWPWGCSALQSCLRSLENPEARDVVKGQIGSVLPSLAEIRQSLKAIARGTGLGTILGALPGNGAVLAPFASYALEKKTAKDPSRFGRGAIEGVAGPEAANNAGAQAAFIPLLTLGIPPNAVMALMVGAMTIHGIVPGPQVMTRNPDLFWGMIASMWIGNLALLIINLPLVGLWVKLLKVPYRFMFPAILAFCCIGVYSINNQVSDVLLTGCFGLLGYTLLKMGFELAPLLLGFVLGGLIEDTFRRAMDLSHGSMMTFVERPISAGLLVLGAVVLVVAVLPVGGGQTRRGFRGMNLQAGLLGASVKCAKTNKHSWELKMLRRTFTGPDGRIADEYGHHGRRLSYQADHSCGGLCCWRPDGRDCPHCG